MTPDVALACSLEHFTCSTSLLVLRFQYATATPMQAFTSAPDCLLRCMSEPFWRHAMNKLLLTTMVDNVCQDITCECSVVCVAGSFNAVELDDLEVATHYVKYAVAAYAIIPVTDHPEKKYGPLPAVVLASQTCSHSACSSLAEAFASGCDVCGYADLCGVTLHALVLALTACRCSRIMYRAVCCCSMLILTHLHTVGCCITPGSASHLCLIFIVNHTACTVRSTWLNTARFIHT
jgi:hypothetical protein